MKHYLILIPFIIVALFIKAQASDILPSGAKIIAGDAKIFNDDKTQVIISNKDRNVISWNDFSVGSENRVIFDNHKYLNLVRGSKASVIEGQVSFSGKDKSAFYLVNPNGITVSKSGSIDAGKIILSTSKISDKAVNDFVDSGEIKLDYKGMGKIKLIGKVSTNNIVIDGSQVIIRDIEDIVDTRFSDSPIPLTNKNGDKIVIKSSTKRMDVGGRSGLNLEDTYKLDKNSGLVDHTGETAISDADDFKKLSQNTSAKYFVTNDIDLGEIKDSVDEGKGFSGSIDGAFNSLSYSLNKDKDSTCNYGLLSRTDGATISNLKIKDASVSVNSTADNVYAGALAGSVKDSTIQNVEVDNFTLKNEFNSPLTIYAGALAGSIDQGVSDTRLHNISADFSLDTLARFKDYSYYRSGSIAGKIETRAKLTGYISQSINKETGFFGEDLSGKNLNSLTFSADENYLEKEHGYTHRDFYAPYFLDGDIQITYNNDEPQSYTYSEFVDSSYFKPENYVDIGYDYESEILDPKIYRHTYRSKENGTRFYFVKNGKNSFSEDHNVEIIDRFVPPPVIPDTKEYAISQNRKSSPAFEDYLKSSGRNLDDIYDYKSYRATLSFFNRIKESRPRISNLLLASLNLDNAQSQGTTLAYSGKNQEKNS